MIANRIFLIEKDEEYALTIKDFLEKSNYQVDISNNVEDTLYKINRIRYSLIIYDIDFYGFEILKYLNKIFIPVIIISKFSDSKTKLQSFKFGIVDYLIKPIDLDELEARINAKLKFYKTYIYNT